MEDQYTLSVKETARVFSFAAGTLYNMINNGILIRGHHYMKIGHKVLIKRKEFIEWMEEQDGCQQAG